LPEHPATATAITTNMTAIRLMCENLISIPLVTDTPPLVFPCCQETVGYRVLLSSGSY
jgi:hypothetical protein